MEFTKIAPRITMVNDGGRLERVGNEVMMALMSRRKRGALLAGMIRRVPDVKNDGPPN